ncbi:SH3 domain-containing protein [Hyphomicrobium sp. LHD-15]|uniref:SH3 domain-containing protein n=1 Tax=Hyphomicrobium sp. LHD-15 TaxID=3072142 RepID=UPI00280F253F|nr:SH3 domain-containing protein [Hyphomicrobium sp. LHD-15]MDQ8700651.1 SH3 domain-containing protein [Hyphomicrobium sp. LHD-15]
MAVATAALAEPVPVGGDELKKSIPGSLVEIDTPLGTKMPIRFGTDGMLAGEAGDLAPILGAPKDRGRWWVDGDKLCSKFFRWFDAEPHCITLARDGSRLFWRKDNGETGTATLVEQAVPDAPAARPPTQVAKAEPEVTKRALANAKSETAKKRTFVEASSSAASAPPARAQEPSVTPAGETANPVSQPVVVARADAAAAASASQDDPTMKFGGTGLMDASSRVGPQGPVRPLEKRAAPKKEEAEKRAAPAKSEAPKKVAKKETFVAQLPAARRDAGSTPSASPSNAPSARALTASEMYADADDARAREVAMPSAASGSRYRVHGVSKGDVLNVRRGPSEQHEQIGGIPPKGRSVEIIGRCYADWCPIRYGKVKGWVNSYYLIAESTQIGSSSPVYTAKP